MRLILSDVAHFYKLLPKWVKANELFLNFTECFRKKIPTLPSKSGHPPKIRNSFFVRREVANITHTEGNR